MYMTKNERKTIPINLNFLKNFPCGKYCSHNLLLYFVIFTKSVQIKASKKEVETMLQEHRCVIPQTSSIFFPFVFLRK